MAGIKTGSSEKRAKRTEKLAASEKLTNGFMLNLTYGLGAIILLEIVRRNYLRWDLGSWDFASKFCIVLGIIFAISAAVSAVGVAIRKLVIKRSAGYTVFFVISSLASFFLSYDIRLSISRKLAASGNEWAVLDFLKNLDLARDTKVVEYGVVCFLVIAFVVYAIRLAKLERKK